MKTIFTNFLLLMVLMPISLIQAQDLKIMPDGVVLPKGDHTVIILAEEAQTVYDTVTNTIWYFDNAVWKEIGGDNLGNHSASQNLNMSDNRIQNLSNPLFSQDGANKSYVDQHEDSDADITNELQEMTVSEVGDTLYLEGGNHIIVPGISDANYIKDGDGNVYQEVEILGQVWLKPSIRSTTFNDGTPIENPIDVPTFYAAGLNSNTPAYMWYNQDSITYALDYGALYNWHVVNTASNGGKNICPIGYKVPSVQEVAQLRDTLSPTNTSLVGHFLKSVGTDYWDESGGLDTYGFSLRGAGRVGGTEFQYVKNSMNFLTTTQTSATSGIIVNTGYVWDGGDNFGLSGVNMHMGHSIRCLKEE